MRPVRLAAKLKPHWLGPAPALGLRAGGGGFRRTQTASPDQEGWTMWFATQRRKPGQSRPSFVPRLESLEERALPSTLTVLNTSDKGPGSLPSAGVCEELVPAAVYEALRAVAGLREGTPAPTTSRRSSRCRSSTSRPPCLSAARRWRQWCGCSASWGRGRGFLLIAAGGRLGAGFPPGYILPLRANSELNGHWDELRPRDRAVRKGP
jgi:hypothetical protein